MGRSAMAAPTRRTDPVGTTDLSGAIGSNNGKNTHCILGSKCRCNSISIFEASTITRRQPVRERPLATTPASPDRALSQPQVSQQPFHGFKSRDVKGFADPIAEGMAMADGDDANTGCAGRGDACWRIFDGDRRLRGDAKLPQGELVSVGGGLHRRHVFLADDRLEAFAQAGSLENDPDVLAACA